MKRSHQAAIVRENGKRGRDSWFVKIEGKRVHVTGRYNAVQSEHLAKKLGRSREECTSLPHHSLPAGSALAIEEYHFHLPSHSPTYNEQCCPVLLVPPSGLVRRSRCGTSTLPCAREQDHHHHEDIRASPILTYHPSVQTRRRYRSRFPDRQLCHPP